MRFYCLSVLFLLMLIGSPLPAAAQPEAADSGYISRFPQSITARVYLQEKVSVFQLNDRHFKKRLNYYPNNYLAIGAGLTIRGIGLNVSMAIPFRDKKESLYGKTRKLDLQLHRYKNKWAADGYFQYYQGFHLRDLTAVTQVVGPEVYPYFPDLRSITIGASLLYMPQGERFSLGAGWNQQERQLKSGGTLLVGSAFFGHFISNKGHSILPEFSSYPQFLDSAQPAYLHNYALTLRGGYAHALVYRRHWFLAAAADAGVGPALNTASDIEGQHRQKVGWQLSATARLALGYNAQKWYAGAIGILHGDRFPLAYEGGVGYSSQGVVRLVVARRLFFEGGHRFWAP